MPNLIKCPTCGENNTSDQQFCQYCQSRLQPLTGNLKGADDPLTPGQIPTKKSTADLEPILPQWLRDARDPSHQTPNEVAIPAAQQNPEPRPASFQSDLLAGLHSQTQDEDEEEVPDWLINITGESSKPKKSQPESSEVRWVELGSTKDFPQSEPEPEAPSSLVGSDSTPSRSNANDPLTDWFQSVNASQNPSQTPTETAPQPPDWLHSMVADNGAMFTDSTSSEDESFGASDTPDWLKSMEAENAVSNSASSDTPDWLKSMEAESAVSNSASSDAPDWLKSMEAENAVSNSASSDTPDWLKSMEEQKTPSGDFASFADSNGSGDEAPDSSTEFEPDWLKGVEPASPSSDQDWLKAFQSTESAEPPQVSSSLSVAPPPKEDEDADLDLPSWLKAAAPQSSIFDDSAGTQEAPPAAQSTSSDSPDWLTAFKSDEPESQASPVFSADAPAFVEDETASIKEDALFTELPDWLSVGDNDQPKESIPAAITNTDAIAPGDLPSWVQAMRPVDAGTPQSASSLSSDTTLEERGALAGLQGVLPAAKGFAPTSKPKSYFIKLQASEEQQAHAALLEKILEAETAPIPLDSSFVIGSSRILRWLLALVLFASLLTVLIMRTQIFLAPERFSSEAQAALTIVRDTIPEGAPVLAIFDYDPSRVGEIESAALPLFDLMILMRHPHLTFISTHPMGALLAERFITSPTLAGHNYQSGTQYWNLGYLPGGQAGIRAFAQNPSQTAPYALAQNPNLLNFALTPAWAAQPVQEFSQFAAVILITDDADSARVWIEQIATMRAVNPLVVISSAQAAPMIQPYYASQQVNGMVSGLYDGALFEQNNAGRPGNVRVYWDAYSIGMLLAIIFILGGGLLNFALGLRDRTLAREIK